jgi:plastocyanin
MVFALAAVAPLIAVAQARPTRHSVSIRNMEFNPSSLTVKPGDTVVWTNADDRDHTVVASDNSFKSENLRPKATFSHTFTKAGRFGYACSYHPRMKATIVVTDAK